MISVLDHVSEGCGTGCACSPGRRGTHWRSGRTRRMGSRATSSSLRRLGRLGVRSLARLCERRHVGDMPPTADRLDQQHARVHTPPQDVDGVPFVGQRQGLSGEDLQVRVHPACVAMRGQLQRFLR